MAQNIEFTGITADGTEFTYVIEMHSSFDGSQKHLEAFLDDLERYDATQFPQPQGRVRLNLKAFVAWHLVPVEAEAEEVDA